MSIIRWPIRSDVVKSIILDLIFYHSDLWLHWIWSTLTVITSYNSMNESSLTCISVIVFFKYEIILIIIILIFSIIFISYYYAYSFCTPTLRLCVIDEMYEIKVTFSRQCKFIQYYFLQLPWFYCNKKQVFRTLKTCLISLLSQLFNPLWICFYCRPKCTIFPRMYDTAFYHCHNFFHNLEHWTSEKNM